MNSNSTEWTASDGRKFAFPVGTAFLLLAVLSFDASDLASYTAPRGPRPVTCLVTV